MSTLVEYSRRLLLSKTLNTYSKTSRKRSLCLSYARSYQLDVCSENRIHVYTPEPHVRKRKQKISFRFLQNIVYLLYLEHDRLII